MNCLAQGKINNPISMCKSLNFKCIYKMISKVYENKFDLRTLAQNLKYVSYS